MLHKKLTMFVVLLGLSSVAAADFYAGAGLGAINLSNRLDSTSTVNVDGAISSNSNNDRANDTTLNGVLLFGYDKKFANKTFLALEAFANYAPLKVDNAVSSSGANTLELSSQMQYNSVYGLRLLPGLQCGTQTVTYAIIGYALANVDIQSSLDNSSNGEQLSSNYIATKGLSGYQLGWGVMTDVSQHLSLRGDMIYTGYQTTIVNSSSSNGVITNEYTLKPYTLEANMALVYHFGG